MSEEDGIAAFEPRVPPSPNSGITRPVVWAVEEERLHNFLLPRDCPRVTFYPGPASEEREVRELMGARSQARAVVAIEAAWLSRVRGTRLFLYRMPAEHFEIEDAMAGYWVSTRRVEPLGVTAVRDCIAAILERAVELRIVPSLWPLRDAVIRSTLHYSCIRMRNAQGRDASPGGDGPA